MPINFQALQPIQAPQIIAQLPASGGGGDDMGGLMEGLQGLIGGLGGMMGGGSGGGASMPSGANTTAASAPMTGAAQFAHGNQGAMMNTGLLGNRVNQSIQAPSQGAPSQINDQLFQSAMKQQGLREGNPALTSYLQKANPNLDPSQTPWCAGYVNSVLNSSGIKGTGSLAAKSFLNFGNPTQAPTRGDIAVFNDLSGKNDPSHGHVGFVDSVNAQNGTVRVLGGNQGNSVSTHDYPLSAVAGFRQPASGQAVQSFAQSQGIQSPQQLAQVPQMINSGQLQIPKNINWKQGQTSPSQQGQGPQSQPSAQGQPQANMQAPDAPQQPQMSLPSNLHGIMPPNQNHSVGGQDGGQPQSSFGLPGQDNLNSPRPQMDSGQIPQGPVQAPPANLNMAPPQEVGSPSSLNDMLTQGLSGQRVPTQMDQTAPRSPLEAPQGEISAPRSLSDLLERKFGGGAPTAYGQNMPSGQPGNLQAPQAPGMPQIGVSPPRQPVPAQMNHTSPTDIPLQKNVSDFTPVTSPGQFTKDPNLTANTIKQFEGMENFKNGMSHARWDVNAYRVGHGSDTYTTSDGQIHKVTANTAITPADAHRDLARRANEFAKGAAGQVGHQTWNNLSPHSQAALTSVAYNYGSIPKRILPAVKSGDAGQISKAIKSLGGDNKGINKGRRNKEASMALSMNSRSTPQNIKLPDNQINTRDLTPEQIETIMKAQGQFNRLG